MNSQAAISEINESIRVPAQHHYWVHYWVHYGQHIYHNDTLRCKTLSIMRGREIVGRVVQVRLKCGQFGSDVVLLRMENGGLQTFENEWLEKVEPRFPPHPSDSIGDTYTIGEDWPEAGFIVKAPRQPETPGSFSMIIATTK